MRLQPVLACLVLALALGTVSSYKYLAVLHTAARSHYIVGSSLLKALAKKGHEVTVISPFTQKQPVQNLHEIPTKSVLEAMNASMAGLLDVIKNSVYTNTMNFHELGINITKAVLEEPAVQDLLASNKKFDAVICEVFLNEAMYGLAEHFNAPLIGLGTFGAIAWNTDMIGSPSPPSYIPNPLLPFTDKMTLMQRIGNLAFLTFERVFLDYYYLPQQEAIYKKHFRWNKRSMREIRSNAAAVLVNTHVSLAFPRPYMPNQIEIGGMHLNREVKPLPEDIKKFIEEAKHGVIYFSMGSNIQSKDLPLETRQIFLNTFRGLKQRVLWKFEETNLAGKPDNVFISNWFPQDDILAHDNVIAFITHGGLLSTTETVYHGKPIVGIPIFGDQFLNMARAEQNGFGIGVSYLELTEERFKSAVERIISDKSYTKKIKAMSRRFRDLPMNPLDLAVHWVEHIVRHDGGKYLHCSGQDLNFWQYHNIDVILILYGGIIGVLLLLVLLLRKLISFAFGTAPKKPTKKVKKN